MCREGFAGHTGSLNADNHRTITVHHRPPHPVTEQGHARYTLNRDLFPEADWNSVEV
jgi:hypothetical protein